MTTLLLDGIACELKSPHDLGWLTQYGRVFCVFDRLISGNLCFGVETQSGRLFIKYAGAQTLGYAGNPLAAVESLKEAALRYDLLAHPNLSPKLDEFRTKEGFGLIFPWFPGYALAPLPLHFNRLRNLPLIERFRMYDELASCIVNASDCDFVAAGIADEHILVDFDRLKMIFCSVDHYLLMPAKTPYAKIPGSPWYVAPEGYTPGETLDEKSNVYAMGALAFTFFGDRVSHAQSGWKAPLPLYREAIKAVSEKKEKRHPSASAFLNAWRNTVLHLPLG